ncbi:MAG: hypothetical protein HKN00_05870 [Flavobacteriaceae bacterium]|nr:hypothetical protein [Bacteroidia bacterium]MBT8287174.1 hypothetical protein [Bacteroidia bacterium]NNF74691.1 hypothetical protein [Flavobacteriaceae bacterium]NNK73343.1 hypothetical protein [Flavobacteriaceae bacterium]
MLILSFFFLYNCSSDDSPSNNNNQSNEVEIMQIEDQAESGTWRITSYIDSGQDETNDFNGYNFTFNANGTLMADNGNMTINGNWSVTDDSNSNDDNPSSDIDFNIAFASPPEFAELTDDWDVVSHSNTRIVLIDVSGGNGGTDNLVFERN